MFENKVELYSMTENAIDVVIMAIKACRNSGSFENLDLDINQNMPKKDKIALITRILHMNHMSIFEHVTLNFTIENISRVCSHQIITHRLATKSQESQRAVNMATMFPVIPNSISSNSFLKAKFLYSISTALTAYEELIKDGTPLEDARYVLPNCCPTKMVMSFNVREMYHIFDMRLCLRAADEIRSVVSKMLTLVQKKCPEFFPEELIGPSCLRYGRCFQNNMQCRRAQEIKQKGKATR